MNSFIFLNLMFVTAVLCSYDGLPKLLEEWEQFKEKYGKSHSNALMEAKALKTYLTNKVEVEKHNMLFEQGKVSYKIGINQFSDMTYEEFAEHYLIGLEQDEHVQTGELFTPSASFAAPKTLDWREKGYVTPVKDQADCGSCWSFSTTGALEGAYKKSKGKLVSWSEQELVDCSTTNNGCHGGNMYRAFEYIQKSKIGTEEDYPYEAYDDNGCRKKEGGLRTGLSKIITINPGNETLLMQALAEHGPISVGIAVSDKFRTYTHGVLNDPTCSTLSLSHGVTLVGYGNGTDGEYWIVKNSWGEAWGNKGYIYLAKDNSNQCKITEMASVPEV